MPSIRKRLLLWQLTALALVGIGASLATYWLAWNSFQKARDHELEQIAYTVVRHGLEGDDDDEIDRGQFVSQIWDTNGELVYSSSDPVMPRQTRMGLNEFSWQGERWRAYTLTAQGLIIQVGHLARAGNERLRIVIGPVLLPLALLMPLLGIAIWLTVSRSLAPMQQIRQELDKRESNTLTPIPLADLPSEIAPMVAAMNDLFVRLHEAIESQRRFVADAAHELRTPLTALRLQAQIAERTADATERAEALARLDAGITRAGHLIEQLLALARLEPESQGKRSQAIALDELARQVVADHSSQAEAKGIDLGLLRAEPATIDGNPTTVRTLLDNLVDNAIRYTPPAGGRVDVSVETHAREVRLIVADNGPGIPRAERDKVFERFYRLAGADTPGSGLGLSIVQRAAEQHDARVSLDDTPGGGLKVTVAFPSAQQAD